MKKNSGIILVVLALIFTLLISTTLAYWQGEVVGAEQNIETTVQIGTWLKPSDGIIEGAFHYYNDISKKTDQYNNPIDVLLNGISVSKFDSIIIFHPDIQRYLVLPRPYELCLHWTVGGCPDPVINGPYTHNNYKIVELEYLKYLKYNPGDVVKYGDDNKLYQAQNGGDINGNIPQDNKDNGWLEFNNEENGYKSEDVYNIDDKVLYNNIVYVSLKSNNTLIPGENNGGWNQYGTLEYIQNNTYFKNDIIKWTNGNFYRAKQTVRKESPLNEQYWMLANEPTK